MTEGLVSTEEKIVQLAIEGSQSAFAQLYRSNFRKIYRYIYFKMSDHAVAEDLTQEVFIKALGAIGSYRPRQSPFSTWLFGIAHNKVVDYYREKGRHQLTSLNENISENEGDPVSLAEQSLQMGDLDLAIQKLAPAQREVISLRFGAELSIAEVAKVLGKREGTIKALQFNATAALKKIMAGA